MNLTPTHPAESTASLAKEPVRIGIVGAGHNTRTRHIPGFQALPGVSIVSVCNRSRASSERVADAFDIPRVYDAWWELVASPDSDAILIGTWPNLHHDATLAALAANKHVLVEARMAMNAREARAMWAAARANPALVTQIVPSPFTLHLDATLQRLLAEGYVGNVVAVEVRAQSGFVEWDAPLHWRHDARRSGLNVMSLGIWYEALLRWLGPAIHVMAQGQTVVKTRLDAHGNRQAVRIPDHLGVLATLAGGAHLSMTLSAVSGLAPAQGAWLYGTEGTLHITPSGQLYGGQRDDDALSLLVEAGDGWRVEAEFINAIRGEEAVRHTTFADGVSYMEFTEAVHRSLSEGRTIAVP